MNLEKYREMEKMYWVCIGLETKSSRISFRKLKVKYDMT